MLPTRFCRKTKFTLSLLTGLFLFSSLCFSLNNLSAHEGEDHTNLFIDSPGESDVILPEQAIENKGRLVSINAKALRSSKLTIRLFNGKSIIAEQKRSVSSNENGSLSWIGEVAGYPGSLVIITEHNGVVAGSISFGTELYQINPTSNGSYVFFQVDEESLPAFGPPIEAGNITEELNSDTSGGTSSSEPQTSSENTGFVIDLLAVYTPESRIRYGQAGIEAKIVSAVEAANQAYQNSLINMSLNIVHIDEINYSETGDMGVTLERLRSSNDGFMDEVQGWRNTYGADMVTMISEDTNYCGIAYIMTTETSSFGPYAFSVTASNCLSNQTLAHELGHNQGNAHDRANSSNAGVYPYSYGFRRCETDGTGFRTVMSYSCSGGTRVNYFSNPNVTYNGFATGIDYNIDPNNSADTAQSMNNTADTVAAFMESVTTNPPDSPSNLIANAQSYDRIDLIWTDNATDETGFKVERSLDQSTWTEIATLGANATNYSNMGLSGNTVYSYRIRAYNGSGNSDYTNIDSATTLDPPPAPDAPTNLTADAVSGNQINLSWSDVNDETGYKVRRSTPNDSNWADIATVGQNSSTYSDTSNLQPSTDYSYHVIAFNNSGDSLPSNTANITTGGTITYFATGETTTVGNRSGTYTRTLTDDGSLEVITEVESGGKPTLRYSYLEHTWHFDIGTGFTVTFHADAYKKESTGDNFIFQFSTDGNNFTDIAEVSSTTPDNTEVWQLPTSISGNIDIKVIDSDRTKGNRSLESINIDKMYIIVEMDSNGTAPLAPSNLTTTVISANQVALTWIDNSIDENGFQIERTLDGTLWSVIDNVTSNVTIYDDFTATPNTSYFFRIKSYNGAGYSDYTTSNQVSTPEGVLLSATGYKEKGVQHANLTWSGASSTEVDIYRNGVLIGDNVTNDGAYIDNIGSKGSGSYTYQIRENTEGNYSNTTEVLF